MSIIFYDHLINRIEIINYVDSLPEPENVKGKVKQLVDDIIHQSIIDLILQKLHPKKHHTFLSLVNERPYDPEILTYLKSHISPEIENEIRDHALKLIADIKKDILGKQK